MTIEPSDSYLTSIGSVPRVGERVLQRRAARKRDLRRHDAELFPVLTGIWRGTLAGRRGFSQREGRRGAQEDWAMPRYLFAVRGTPFLDDPHWLEELPDDQAACAAAGEVAGDLARHSPD